MDKRNEYEKMKGDAAEDVIKERATSEKNIEAYKNSFIEYMGQQDIFGELRKIKDEQQEIEEKVKEEEKKKKESCFYRFLSKLKKTL